MGAIRKLKNEKYNYKNYKEWNDSEDWEIINGVAYNMAPSPARVHQEIAGKIFGKIFQYLEKKECNVYYEWDVILSEENIVKPDIFIVCDKNKLTDKNLRGAPDLVIEILSPSTAARDCIMKMELYRKYGVKEYWIVDPYNNEIRVNYFYKNINTVYNTEQNEMQSLIPIEIFNGELKLDLKYIFKNNN